MTREEAKNTLKSLKDYYNDKSEYCEDGYVGFDNEDNEALDLAIKALEQTELNPSYNSVKTELEQTMWIPVSERLPNAYEFVNCTCHSLIDDREDWVIETVYIPQPSDSPYSDWGNIPMLNSGDCKVVAWMHRDIPEPYIAESEDKE